MSVVASRTASNAAHETEGQQDACGSRSRVVRRSTNEDLIGKPGSRLELDTPCLVLDVETLENNIAEGARIARDAGKSFWPHVKAHKCTEIAHRQIAAGADGLCAATIGEAEVLAENGIQHLHLTSTFATDRQIGRLIDLALRGAKLTLVIDHANVAHRLAVASLAAGIRFDVLIDVNMGRDRAGCSTVEEAVSLAKQVVLASQLNLAGAQLYAGQLSHKTSFAERKNESDRVFSLVDTVVAAIRTFIEVDSMRCSGGSTGSIALDVTNALLTDVQWGSYALMDVEYMSVEHGMVADGTVTESPFHTALFVASRVISACAPGKATLDAGDKRFANKYGALPQVIRGPSGTFRPVSDEHGQLEHGEGILSSGRMVELIVPHCDPTVNLFDHLHVVDGDMLVDIWPVSARGMI